MNVNLQILEIINNGESHLYKVIKTRFNDTDFFTEKIVRA